MTTLNDDPNQIDLNLPGLGPDTIFAGAGADFARTSTLGGSLIFGQGDNDTLIYTVALTKTQSDLSALPRCCMATPATTP
jgi:hypothetical protein